MLGVNAGRLVREARRHAGLTQRVLAARVGVAQSAVAKIESDVVVPRADTLERLLEACGWALESMPRLGVGVDRSGIREALRQSPAERLGRAEDEARSLDRLLSAGRP
jgi:transcriptional regulator with XRE-family HTH domain